MATVSLHLKEPGADRPTSIYALLTVDRRHRIKVYTGQSIHPSKWIKADQRAQVKGRGNELNGHLNDALAGIGERLLLTYSKYLAAGTVPTAAQLKEAASPVAAPAAPTAPANPLGTFSAWIEGRALTHTPNTLRTYRTTLRHLTDFQTKTKSPLSFDTMGSTFAQRLAEYLLTHRQLRDTAVRKNLVILKCFLGWATEAGHPVSPDYKKITWQRREPDILTLTRGELAAIVELDLTQRTALDNARALFLLGVYTGLRFSDVAALRPEHIHADRLRLTTQKTRDTLTIPIRPEVRPLLALITAGTLRPLPNQVLNRHLKELAALASIDTLTERTHYAGGKRHTTTAPKHTLITTHTARRTFVTLALEAGLRPELIMKITGHKDLKSFSRYVNVTEDTVLTEFARVYES
jgi:integrase